MVRRVNDDLMHAIAAAKGGATDGTDGQVMRLADDQFQVLVDLLTPGYELALAYKAEMADRDAKRAEYEASAGYDTGHGAAKSSIGETGASGVMDPGPAIGAAHVDPIVPASRDPSAQGSG